MFKNNSKKLNIALVILFLIISTTSIGLVSYQLINANRSLDSNTEAALNTGSSTFTRKFLTNDTAEVKLIGNTNLSCIASESGCTTTQAGTTSAKRNNDFNMKFIDIDSDSSTFNSSSAKLTLNPDDEILWAGLFWGGADGTPNGNSPSLRDANALNRVKLKIPGNNSYSDITGSLLGRTEGTTTKDYMAFAEITNLVKDKGAGDFFIANIQLGEGKYFYGGWSISFVIKNSKLPIRNVSVFTGHTRIATDTPVKINLSGFLTPKTGDVRSRIAVVALDGDKGVTGDTIKLNGKTVSNSLNPPNDFFNSSNTELGVEVSARNPSHKNLLGFDIDQIEQTNLLSNNQTSTTLELVTDGGDDENYNPFAVTIASEIYSPDIDITKTGSDINGGQLRPADTIQYTINAKNSGQDESLNNIITEKIPANTTFVPGSIKVDGVTKTDGVDNDNVKFDSSTNTIQINVGTGANATAGGTLSTNQTVQITFQVTVNPNTPNNTQIQAQADMSYKTATLGLDISGESNLVMNVVAVDPTPSVSTTPSTTPTTTTTVAATPSVTTTQEVTPTVTVTTTVQASPTTTVTTTVTATSTVTSTSTITTTQDPNGATVTTTPSTLPDTGVFDDGMPFYIAGSLVVLSIVVFAVRRRRSLEEKVLQE